MRSILRNSAAIRSPANRSDTSHCPNQVFINFETSETRDERSLLLYTSAGVDVRHNLHRPTRSTHDQRLGVLTELIRPQLAAVEDLFHSELSSDLKCVNTLVKHVSRFRGKMLRPCLVLLTAKAVNPTGQLTADHVKLATVVEMVHMATLVHDDVLDEAELRRKGATINHLRGNEAAVILGDYLISHSYHLCSDVDNASRGLPSQYASRLIAKTTNDVCSGELLQLDNRNNLDLDEQTYLEIIKRRLPS